MKNMSEKNENPSLDGEKKIPRVHLVKQIWTVV